RLRAWRRCRRRGLSAGWLSWWTRRLGRLGRRRCDDGRRRGRRGATELPVEPVEIALSLHESLDVRRVPQEHLTELLAAAGRRALDRLDLLRDAKRPEGARRRDDVFVRVRLPGHGDVAREVGQRPGRHRAPQPAGHAPLPDLEGPAEVRWRVEIELGSPLEDDLGDAEILAEVELFAGASREDVDILLDPHQD